MTIQVVTAAGSGSVALTNSVRTQYIEEYLEAAAMERLYDQIASPIGKPMEELKRGSSVQVEYLSDMTPSTSAISEVIDLVPQALRDATGSVTPTSRADAIQCSELLLIQAFTDYGAKQYRRVGKALMESVEILARNAATQGSNVRRGGTTTTTRILLDAGTSGHRCDDVVMNLAAAQLQALKVPGFPQPLDKGGSTWAAITHPAVYNDLRNGGNVVSIAQYSRPDIILQNELGMIGKFRLVISPWAKIFGSAGAANAAPVETTLQTAVNPLATTINVAAATNLATAVNAWYTIAPTHETGNTHQALSERFRYVNHTGSTVTIIGEGANGGLRFAHSAGDMVSNDDTAYTVVLGGPSSLAKVYATEIGEFGQIVGPKRDGLVDQFVSLGYKWYGGYGRLAESHLLRLEVSSQADA
jgi:N4-gp56 family major capsid protein